MISKQEKIRRKKISLAGKRLWRHNRKRRKATAKCSKLYRSKTSVKAKYSRLMKNRWKDPKYKEYMTKISRQYWKAKASKEAASKRMSKRFSISSNRLAQSVKVAKFYVDNPDRCKLIAIRLKKEYATGKRTPAHRGKYGTLKTTKGGKIKYRSTWELAFIKILESSKLVLKFTYEPCLITYKWVGEEFTYIPDFLVELKDKRKILVEIKPRQLIGRGYRVKNKFKAAKVYCAKHGMTFVHLATKPTSMQDILI